MSRLALAATRAVAVLNFLAAHPTQAFTLSDLADRLGINVASMHALLNALTDDGYLVRNPRLKTYALGPAVVALGTAALETHPAIDLARDAARDLAKSTGLEVAVTTVAGDDEIVFVARVGDPSARGLPIHVGQRVPFVPPFGSVFVAWGDGESWLAKADDPDSLRPVLDAVRARGYSIALEASARIRFQQRLDELASSPSDHALRASVGELIDDLGRRRYHLRNVDPKKAYDVSMIAAPVFGPDGDVVLALTLIGFPPGISGAEIASYGEQMRDAGLVITKRTRGRVPTPNPA